jgi:hypothetical protein
MGESGEGGRIIDEIIYEICVLEVNNTWEA